MMPTIENIVAEFEDLWTAVNAANAEAHRLKGENALLKQRLEAFMAGSHMTAPLSGGSHLVLLTMMEDLGDGLWRARRLAFVNDAYVEDDDDILDYIVEPPLDAGGLAVGDKGWAAHVRDEVGPPPRAIYQMVNVRSLPFLAACTACNRDPASGNTIISAKRLTGLPYSWQTGEEVTAIFCGSDPLVVLTSMVLIQPIVPLDDNPEIAHFAIPHLAVNPQMLDEPSADCLITYGTPCEPFENDPCVQS